MGVLPVPADLAPEGVPGFDDAVEGGGGVAPPSAFAIALEEAEDGEDADSAGDDVDPLGETLATVVVMVDAELGARVTLEVVIEIPPAPSLSGFLSSIAMIANVTPTPVSVASAAVPIATPIGRFPVAGGSADFAGAWVALDAGFDAASVFGACALAFGVAFRVEGPALACASVASAPASITPAAPAESSVATPRRVAALISSGTEGDDDRAAPPASSCVAAFGATFGEGTVSGIGSSGTRARSSGATS